MRVTAFSLNIQNFPVHTVYFMIRFNSNKAFD